MTQQIQIHAEAQSSIRVRKLWRMKPLINRYHEFSSLEA